MYIHIKEEDMKNAADNREVDMKVETEEEKDEAAAAEKEKRQEDWDVIWNNFTNFWLKVKKWRGFFLQYIWRYTCLHIWTSNTINTWKLQFSKNRT